METIISENVQLIIVEYKQGATGAKGDQGEAGEGLAVNQQAALDAAPTLSADDPVAALSNVAGRQPYHGFVNGLTALTHSFAGTTYTLGKTGGSYTYWRNGVATTYAGADKTVDFATKLAWGNGTTDPLGQWFVWLDANGDLDAGKAVWDILSLSITLVATVYVQSNGLGGFEGIPAKEPHDYRRNLIENRNNHDSFGAQYVSGFSPLTIGTGVAGNAVNTFSLAGGTFRDEDLYHVLTNPQTSARIGYRENGLLKFDAAGPAYAKLSAGAPVYDNAGTLTAIAVGRYGVEWVFSTNRENTPVTVIVGQGEYTSIALAQAAAMPSLPGLSVAEWKLLYRVIVRNVAGALQWVQSDTEYNKSTGPAISGAAVTTISAGNVTTTPTGALTATNQQTTNEQLEAGKQAANAALDRITSTPGNPPLWDGAAWPGGGSSETPLYDRIPLVGLSTWTTNQLPALASDEEWMFLIEFSSDSAFRRPVIRINGISTGTYNSPNYGHVYFNVAPAGVQYGVGQTRGHLGVSADNTSAPIVYMNARDFTHNSAGSLVGGSHPGSSVINTITVMLASGNFLANSFITIAKMKRMH